MTIQEQTLELADLDAACDLAAVGDDPRHVAVLRNYQALRELGTWVVLNGQGADEIMGGYVARPTFVRHILDVRRPRRRDHPVPARLAPDTGAARR